MFLPPILEEMEETKNWWNISILAHVASWLDTPKENFELWLAEIGKNIMKIYHLIYIYCAISMIYKWNLKFATIMSQSCLENTSK